MILTARRFGCARPDSHREIVDGAHPSARPNSARVIPRAWRMARIISCGWPSTRCRMEQPLCPARRCRYGSKSLLADAEAVRKMSGVRSGMNEPVYHQDQNSTLR